MNDVTAVYDNGIRAVNKASLRVDEGEFVFLVGASGSGKTTIIKLLTAEVRPTEGKVLVNNYNIGEMKKRQLSANEEDLLVTLEAVYEFNMRGFEFAPIDLYESEATKFAITPDGRLRPPFVSISGLGETAAIDLARVKTLGKQFISIQELGAACPKVSQTHLDTLRELGALGDMPESNQINLFDM